MVIVNIYVTTSVILQTLHQVNKELFLDTLKKHNQEIFQKAMNRINEIEKEKAFSFTYPLEELKDLIVSNCKKCFSLNELSIQMSLIDRKKLGGDLALKFPSLLAIGGPKIFIKDYLPKIKNFLESDAFNSIVEEVIIKGMYINLILTPSWYKNALDKIINFNAPFGPNDDLKDKRVVIDYSSPNAAKTLHAGHIRSTIIGHVLGNLYKYSGAKVFRVNHINDFGGFGHILEGYKRFGSFFSNEMSNSAKLVTIYKIRRTLEKVSASSDESLIEEELSFLKKYIPKCNNLESFKDYFLEFTKSSDEEFKMLENGNEEQVNIWKEMMEWCWEDFSDFYRSLNVNIDFTLGESFYFHEGNELVEDSLRKGSCVVFNEEMAQREIESLSEVSDQDKEKILKDIGATLVPLKNGRFVVRRKDGRSIYSTRDLGAIKKRIEMFSPTDILYIVGQEQNDHFQQLFESSKKLNLINKENLKHLSFGFYVNAKTGKKLSSRESASGVKELLIYSQKYFENKLDKNIEHNRKKTAKDLSIGSIVFNDLKQDIKSSVEIDSESLDKTIEKFEKSGGAYVIYAACRAGSIIRKVEDGNYEQIDEDLNLEEYELILKMLEIPKKIAQSALQNNPTSLIKHLHDLASMYNTYYAKYRVLDNNKVHTNRLNITRAISKCLRDGLEICHITCPERI